MELINGHESFLALSNRGALSILDASFKFARASYLVSGEPWSTVRMEQRAFGGILSLFRSDWSLRWLDVCICTDASEKGFEFAVREGCRELASDVGRVSERARFKRSSRTVRARSRALRSIAPQAVLECSSSDEEEMSLARRESRADSRESLQLLDPSGWQLVAYGKPTGLQRVNVRWDASSFFLTILRWCWRSAKDAQTKMYIAFSHAWYLCVWCPWLVLSDCSGGYRQS